VVWERADVVGSSRLCSRAATAKAIAFSNPGMKRLCTVGVELVRKGSFSQLPSVANLHGLGASVRSAAIPHLQTTFAFWYLASDSELVFDGDTGDTEPTPASRRYGIEFRRKGRQQR
jgi:hypothetical protein